MRSVAIVSLWIAMSGTLPGCAILQQTLPGITMSDANVVEVLNQISKDEIEAGELARERGDATEVQAFAGRVVSEHRGLAEKNRRLAQLIDVRPKPPSLSAALKLTHEEAMEELRKKYGPAFDRAYIQHEIAMHVQAYGLLETAAEVEDNAALKQYLVQAGPDLLSHLSAAKAVERHLARAE